METPERWEITKIVQGWLRIENISPFKLMDLKNGGLIIQDAQNCQNSLPINFLNIK